LRFFELPKMIQRKSVKSVTEKRTLEFLISWFLLSYYKVLFYLCKWL
jgi:hypothetical protein